MKRSSFDSAVARHGLSAVRQMSAAGMPVLPENPVRRCVSREAHVPAPGEGISSRPLSGAASHLPRSATFGAADGQHGTPSPEAAGAKMGGVGTLNPYRAGNAPGHRLSHSGHAVTVSDATLFILRLIAAHEGRPERDIVAQLIAAAGEAIGLSPLLTHAAGEIGDLSGLPNYARRAANRFRGGVP